MFQRIKIMRLILWYQVLTIVPMKKKKDIAVNALNFFHCQHEKEDDKHDFVYCLTNICSVFFYLKLNFLKINTSYFYFSIPILKYLVVKETVILVLFILNWIWNLFAICKYKCMSISCPFQNAIIMKPYHQ